MDTPSADSFDFASLELLGGRLPLDFVNTVSRRVPAFEGEYLNSYDDLSNWSVHVGILTAADAARLRAKAAQQPQEAQAITERAVALREALHRLFSGSGMADDLRTLNQALALALSKLKIEADAGGYGWTWGGDPLALDRMLWVVARQAADLLTSPELSRVRECPSPDGCGWMFLDTSKNRSRRWCSMETCGNAAKARRHYRRHRRDKHP